MQHTSDCSTENIKELIAKSGLSCKRIAKLTGVSEESLSAYRNRDKVTIGIRNAIKLADFFGVSLDFLVGRCSKEETIETMDCHGKHLMKMGRKALEAHFSRNHTNEDKEVAIGPVRGYALEVLPWPYNIVNTVLSGVYNGHETVIDYIITAEHEQKIVEIINLLKPQQCLFLFKKYRDGLTLREISKEQGVTAERVRQVIICGIYQLMRSPLKDCFLYGEEYFQQNNSLKLKESELRRETKRLEAWERKLDEKRISLEKYAANLFHVGIDHITGNVQDILDTPFDKLGFSTRPYNKLHESCETLADVMKLAVTGELAKIYGLGERSLREILAKIYYMTGENYAAENRLQDTL